MQNVPVKDFFVSYTKADRSWAEWIAWELEEAGYSVVLQAWDFRPGSSFVLEMQKATAGAERTIAVLSPDYLESEFAQSEWAAAFARDPTGEQGILLPVRIRKCDLKGLLPQIIYIDLVGEINEDAARKVLHEGISREGVRPINRPIFPGAPQRAVLNQPRFPGSLPSISNVPHNRNPNFTGRKELLKDLRTKLTSGQPAAWIQAIHGLGGVGKTQTAVEYAYDYGTEYDAVWWVRAEESATLAADYVCLARELGLPEKDATEQSAIVKAVRRWLGQNRRWLLVFDNVQDPMDIREFLPQASTGHVLITSRNPNWGGTASTLHVEVMDRSEAVEFLLNRTRQTDKDAAAKLAGALGDLPLALEQAGAYIEQTGRSLSYYWELFQKQWRALIKRGTSADDQKKTVATTWEISFKQVKKISKKAEDLLSLCAFLAPDDIPLEVIISRGEHCQLDPPAALATAMKDPVAFNDVVAALRRYSLLKSSNDQLFSIHRLVQSVRRARLTEKDMKAWATAAVFLLSEAFQFNSSDEALRACKSLLPHALVATKHARECRVAYETTGRLLSAVGRYSIGRAEFTKVKAAFEQALADDEEAYGREHHEVATDATNLGFLLKNQGQLESAQEYFERALAINEKARGPEHPEVAISLNNLGIILKDKGDLDGARARFERALTINEKAHGREHPEVATNLNNLGYLLKDKGDLDGAQGYFERALAINEKAYGPEHPEVAISLSNLGYLLKYKGDLEGARARFERALAINEKAYGADHHNLAVIVSSLGSVLKEQGDLKGARAHFERALKILQESQGDHRHLVTVQKHLASLDSLQGKSASGSYGGA